MIFAGLFFCFLKVGIFSIGGGYAAVPVIQSQVVDKFGWINLSEFTDLISIAEMTPGPITVNSASFIGLRMAGIPGALTATAGFLLPSLFIVTAMYFIYKKYGKMKSSQTVLSYIRPAVVALIASAGLTILSGVVLENGVFSAESINILAAVLFAAAFFAMRKFKLNPIVTMLSCGGIYLAVELMIK